MVNEDTREFIDYKIRPGLRSGIYGNIDFFSSSGVGGWVLNYGAPELPVNIFIKLDDIVLAVGVTELERPDVIKVAKVDGNFGYRIPWNWAQLATVLQGYEDDDRPAIEVITNLDSRPLLSPQRPTAGEIRGWLKSAGYHALSLTPFSPEWCRAIRDLPQAADDSHSERIRGHLEGAYYSREAKVAVLWGWLVNPLKAVVWIEDAAGTVFSTIQSYRFFRQDIHDYVSTNRIDDFGIDNGIVVVVPCSAADGPYKLKALLDGAAIDLSQTQAARLSPIPAVAAKMLFNIHCPSSEFSQRVSIIDLPILSKIIEYRNRNIADLPTKSISMGKIPDTPVTSIIIPLYGADDLVDHQMIEFSSDDWIKSNAEIIYVIDDSNIAQNMDSRSKEIYDLYNVPFRFIWGKTNRGFSGANNLGAALSRGKYLLFMNSDVFPECSGWLRELTNLFAEDPYTGILGPRLVFPDGSIQHAGMVFSRRDDLDVWTNQHPNLGLDVTLDPNMDVTEVPAVTGACLMIARKTFDDVGGWDTGYLIGDFEDSDLCLKVKSLGLKILYTPNIQLVHLERQSFKLFDRNFRGRVTLFNAVRHQTRWHSLLETSSARAK